MTRDDIKRCLIEVLRHVQSTISGITPIEITGSTKPLEDIEKFTSKRWPAARTLLAIRLGIPREWMHGENIFRSGRSTPRTVDEVADRVCEILETRTDLLRAA